MGVGDNDKAMETVADKAAEEKNHRSRGLKREKSTRTMSRV